MLSSPRFIPNSVLVKMRLNNIDDLVYKEGLVDLGVADACIATSSQNYHDFLTRKKLTDQPFLALFPRNFATVRSYAQVLVVDLSECKLATKENRPAVLTVTTSYNKTLSPANYNIVHWTLQQYCYTHLSNNKWKFDLVD